MLELPYVNIEGLEECLNKGVSRDESVTILTNQFRKTDVRDFRDERLGQYPFKREFCLECPIAQDQPRPLWIFPLAETMEDIVIGNLYAEKGSLDKYNANGADYLRLQIRLKKPRKLQGGVEPGNRTLEIYVIDYHREDKGLSVTRQDYIPGILFSRETEVKEIDTGIVVPRMQLQSA